MTNRLFTENKNIKENVKNDIFLKQQVERIKSDSEKFANKDIAALTNIHLLKSFMLQAVEKNMNMSIFYIEDD